MITGKGQLRHIWHGSYSATIAIDVDTAAHALQLLSLADFAEWRQSTTAPTVILWHGSDNEKQESMLVRYGADRRKIGSLARSIDFGEPFTIAVSLDRVITTAETQEVLF